MEETDIIICLKKIKKHRENIKKTIARLEKILHNDKMHFKIAIASSFINF